MNKLKTLILLSTLTALLIWTGQALGGAPGMWLALVLAAVMNIGSYWFSDRIVLRMYHAREAGPQEAPELYEMVRDLATRASIPMPRIYIIPEEAPNAFATGRNPKNGVVAVTEGLVRILDKSEVAAVIAHELAHIRNRDTLIMAVAATIGGALSTLSNMAMWGSLFGGGNQSSEDDEYGSPSAGLLGMLIAPFVATLIQMSISRAREFMADEAAAQVTGMPLALARALRKIEVWSERVPMHSGSEATAHLFIHNPFNLRGLSRLFSTHPPTEERIARLEAMVVGRTTMAA